MNNSRATGYLAVISAVTIWGAWVALTRYAVIGTLTPAAVTLLRVGIPVILLAPVLFRTGVWPKGKSLPFLFCILGAGAPFLLIIGNGMRYAPTADVGPLVPGTMPLIVALLSVVLLKEKLGWSRALGFALCAAGVLTIAGRSILTSSGNTSFGHLLLITAAFCWACYTVAFRFVGVTAIEMAALVSFWSAIVMVPFGLPPLLEAFNKGAYNDLIVQAIIQGLGSGLVALVLYNIGLARLGASRAAAFVALVPALATVIAIPLLKEIPDAASIFGVVTTGLGVLLASGVLNELRASRS
ncbi:MAG: DMT family transporter [Xanthobacteraceae bacterium]|nr:DMT family transporter [Xanthobacteraceae bacterium]QYK44550.1 MAG: DMT family transporter [Xanthobacteraceae bacterium]